MAKYTITYKCGHTAEVQLYGKESERQRKIEWYKTINCPQCEAEAQKAEAEANGLPELSGSDKQVAWATKIRNNALAIINEANEHNSEDKKKMLTEYRDKWLTIETKAAYWIDNRFNFDNAADIVRAIIKSTNFNAQQK